MKKHTFISVCLLAGLLWVAVPATPCSAGLGLLRTIVMYAPNRVLDVLDLVRVRLRVGPGGLVGVRATQLASLSYGLYKTVYIGLPGPRQGAIVKLPIGLESFDGVHVMGADIGEGAGHEPDYSLTEIGLDVQVLFVGVAVGVDLLLELADLAAGVLFWDLLGDDL